MPLYRNPKNGIFGDIRESSVERRLVRRVDAAEGAALKFVSPGKAGVPDRLILMPVPPEHQELVGRYVRFVEVKRPGEELRPLQVKVLNWLRKLGFRAEVVSTPSEVDQWAAEL